MPSFDEEKGRDISILDDIEEGKLTYKYWDKLEEVFKSKELFAKGEKKSAKYVNYVKSVLENKRVKADRTALFLKWENAMENVECKEEVIYPSKVVDFARLRSEKTLLSPWVRQSFPLILFPPYFFLHRICSKS